MPDLLSSPSHAEFSSWAEVTEIVLAGGVLEDMEYVELLHVVKAQQKVEIQTRRSLQKDGRRTDWEGKRQIKQKHAMEQADYK